jgi:hypothetical protein
MSLYNKNQRRNQAKQKHVIAPYLNIILNLQRSKPSWPMSFRYPLLILHYLFTP